MSRKASAGASEAIRWGHFFCPGKWGGASPYDRPAVTCHVGKATVLLVVLIVAACSPASQATARPSPPRVAGSLPAGMPSPDASPSTSAAATPASYDLSLATVSFTCRLPITTPNDQGAFVSFPTGAVSFDPQGRGVGSSWGLYYDRAFSRWLPVPRQAVSADGRHYAYGERGADQTQVAKMHVVDIATGIDHVFATPTTVWFVPFEVLDYANEGIYLYTNYEMSIGVSVMDPTTGTTHAVASLPDIQASGGNRTFWVGTVNQADPNPLGGIGVMPNQIDRYSLVDGTRVPWFYRPSTAPRVVGLDTQGHPIVMVVNGRNGVIDGDYGAELILLMSSQSQRSMYKGSSTLIGSMVTSISDSHGTWFGTDHGIYLYTGTAFIKVSNQPGYPANGCF